MHKNLILDGMPDFNNWIYLIKPYSANKAKPPFADLFLWFILKIASCAVCGDFGKNLLLCSSHLFTFVILLRKYILILPGRYSSTHENKS